MEHLLRIRISDGLYNRLMTAWKKILEYSGNTEGSYPFTEFIKGCLSDSLVTPKEEKQLEEEITEIVRQNPGISPRQIADIMGDRHPVD